MKQKNLLAAALFAALSGGMAVSAISPVLAANNQVQDAAVATADKPATEQELVPVSSDARMTMRNVRSARLALFEGQPTQAQTFLDAAMARAAATVKDADKYAVGTRQELTGDQFVPFSASLTVAESFVPTADKMKHIAKAHEHLRKGENKQALEVLKLGEVDVAVATELLPVKFAQQHVEDADKLVGEGKYYEANLALKAIEDAIVIESVGIESLPQDQNKGQS